jgi:Holliday junction DNA helicase RuvA
VLHVIDLIANEHFELGGSPRVDTPALLINNRCNMIGQLRGKLTDRRPNQVMVDVAGVGYLVQIPLSTFSVLGGLNSDVTLLIHTHVREDQFTLYGFLTAREKQIFEMLLLVSGVGPSLALKILSGMRISELLPAIRNSDLALLERIPGIGKKTAERIVVELRDKAAMLEPVEAGKPAARSPLESDVASALLNLGYEGRSVERTLEQIRKSGAAENDFNALLRAALQQLGGAKMQKGAHSGNSE